MKKIIIKRLNQTICIIICLSLLISFISTNALSGKIRDSKYVADLDTMDTYQEALINGNNGTRYAGRVWSDKSVFLNDITLDDATDGYKGKITNNSDFLNAFSALGSSLRIIQPVQLDFMFLIDVSGSMGKIGNELGTEETFKQTPIYIAINQVNESINTLLEESPDSRFGIAIYGATATVLVPLGYYTKANNIPFLKVDYKEAYGNTQGLHFTLTATVKDKNNNVKKYYADNAGKTSDEVHGKDGTGNRKHLGTGGQTSGSGTELDSYHVGHITNQQAGLAIAMDQFITGNNEISWVSSDNNSKYPRIPILLHLTDGQASDIAWIQNEANIYSADDWKKSYSNWNNVNWKYDLAYNSPTNAEPEASNYYNASQLSGTGDAAPVIFQTLMTAAYYKSAVDAYYTSSGLTDFADNLPYLRCYSIYASDSSGYEEMEDSQVKGTINAILDPSNYFTDLISTDEVDSGFLDVTEPGAKFIDTAYELYKLWLNNSNNGVDISFYTNTTSAMSATSNINDINISLKVSQSQLTNGSGAYNKEKYEWADEITTEAIKKNIYYVPNGNFYSTDFKNLGGVLDDIIKSVAGSSFTPVGGINDLGYEDSIVYMDPLGKYTEIKDKGIIVNNKTYDMAMLLFGDIHYLQKAKVFDYQFMQNHLSSGTFKVGWYDKNGTYKNSGNWDDGDIYYIDESTFKSLIPDTSSNNALTSNQQNTIYTFYEFIDSDKDIAKVNPCYGEDNAKYILSEIKIWNEDSSHLKDETGLKIDNTLYVNIPINALPLQAATVTLIEDEKVEKYETNIENKKESTPLRLFYGVGIQDHLLYNNGLDIDLSLVTEEYKEKYTNFGTIHFYSNYYSETTYDGYAADTQEGARTKGDAVLSISPSEKNRYYIFQKHLKLYKYAYIVDDNGNVHKENNPLLFEGAIFDGEFKGQTENDNPNETAKNEITQAFNEGKLKKGDLIVLDGDVVKYGTNPSSDEFYYFVVDYYMPTTGGNGKQVQYAVARMGSEFGSGIVEHEGTKLPKGDFLSWYDQSGQNSEVYNYDDTIPASKLSSGDWILVTKIGGLRIGDLHQNIQLKTENKTNTSKSYYLPIIADDSSTEGSDAIFNVYLGNNGSLTYKIDRYELPLAGGIGVVIIYVIGISLIVGSIIYFIIMQSKKNIKKSKT